jgi:hypothetical protein
MSSERGQDPHPRKRGGLGAKRSERNKKKKAAVSYRDAELKQAIVF